MKIPFGKPIIENKEIQEVCKTLKSSILVHGKKTEEFENLFNRFTGSKFGASVSSCTTGMHLVYKFLGIGSGDEVLVTSQSHVATAHCIEYVGAKPVFIDCELQTGNIDLNKIEEKITKKTKAIAIVHFAGIPVNMNLLNKISKKFKLKIIEDCALALGSKINNKHVGLIGEAGIFSFYPIKHITTIEGGMIISKNKKLIDFVKKNRAFGYKKNTRDKNSLYDVDSLGLI
jgi:Predicted pyridoxal phosphate-dependent enzyme apparently involved in regulation of cell wall biogenesis